MRNTDSRIVYLLAMIEVFGSIMYTVNKVLMCNGQFLITPSWDDTCTGKFIKWDCIGVGFEERNAATLRWDVLYDNGFLCIAEIKVSVVLCHNSRHWCYVVHNCKWLSEYWLKIGINENRPKVDYSNFQPVTHLNSLRLYRGLFIAYFSL